MSSRVIFALGGNAILTKDASAQAQQNAIKTTAEKLANYIKVNPETQVVITHGNGPQVGNLLLQEALGSSEGNPAMPLDAVGAMTQGQIGLWMDNALNAALPDKKIATIITRTIVDKKDQAFKNPTKPIGMFYTKEELGNLRKEHPNWIIKEDAGRGYRRVVPSPKPISILETESIKSLVDSGTVLVAGGGGGIPVVQNGEQYLGVEAVIDKDFTAAKLAEVIDADELVILTAVDMAYINYGTPAEQPLHELTVETAQKYVDENEFAEGSMKPKILALMSFVEKTGKKAIMTSLDNISDYKKNGRATIIYPN